MAAYPDALVVQTHRAPETIIASMCALAEHATPGWSTTFVGEQIGGTNLRCGRAGCADFTAARAKYDPAQFVDVDFADLRSDPFGTVEKVYAALGTEPSEPSARGHDRSRRGECLR